MQKIHLDTDLGGDIDDLCALAMLLKWDDVDITGITTVAEEDGRRAGYVKYVLKLAGRDDIPVKAGANCLDQCRYQKLEYPPDDENWSEKIAPAPNPLDEALDLLKHSIDTGAIIVAIGPFTNLYLLDKKYPGILSKARLYLMGGYIYPVRQGLPQWGNDMDWNIQFDITSAKYVLEHSNPTLIPLTVTVETALKRESLEKLSRAGDMGQLLVRQVELHEKLYKNEEKYGLINFQHDPLAVAIALGWRDEVEIQQIPLEFEQKDGWLHETIAPTGKLIPVVTKIDGGEFSDYWVRVVTR